MWEKRQTNFSVVSFDCTSNSPTNVLIAPLFGSIGRAVALLSCCLMSVVVTLTPSRLVSVSFAAARSSGWTFKERIDESMSSSVASADFLPLFDDLPVSTGCGGCGIHMRVALYRGSNTSAAGDTEALVEQSFFQRGQE